MDCVPIDIGMEQIKNESTEQILSPCSSRLDLIFGDPELLPRVGDQYQAKLPPVQSKHDIFHLIRKPTNSESSYSLGLPIPVMWTKREIENIVGEKDEKALSPLPGTLGGRWTVIEHESFLLCLYIFGKNLIHFKRFLESKDMGDILCYYYGKFYLSAEYHRWSESRKSKGKCSFVHGKRILTGWRQHELLSRLKCHVSEETQNGLLKISKKFNERKLLFEEYATDLKNTAGIQAFVDAIGIGKGKQDLTNVAMEPSRTFVQPEIPTGKACAFLKSADIIKFLTGGFRLSKGRSHDLFWEAVWPRLLAQGWHSEKPKTYGISRSKNLLVFLIPGVKKFSRRLENGKHYFNSISDILNKVASEPELLEVEEIDTREDNEECRHDLHVVSNGSHNFILQAHKSITGDDQEAMKFTVVDTSFDEGANIRALRILPVESSCSNLSNETERFTDSNTNPADDLNNGRACDDSSDFANTKLIIDTTMHLPKNDLGRPSIDLNVPQVSPDGSLITDIKPKKIDSCSVVPEYSKKRPEPLKAPDNGFTGEKQLPEINNRRQSTRNRPMTTRALEAFAFGLFHSPKKRKATSPGKSMPMSSKRVYGRTTRASSTPNDMDIAD